MSDTTPTDSDRLFGGVLDDLEAPEPPREDLVLVRKDSGGVFPDGTTNHPAIDFGRPVRATPAEPGLLRERIEALPVSQYPMVKGAAVEALVSRRAVLAALSESGKGESPPPRAK